MKEVQIKLLAVLSFILTVLCLVKLADAQRVDIPLTVAAAGHSAKSTAAASPSPLQQVQQSSSARMVDLKASDGTHLKASYFAALKPGPGVLLLHQANRQRKVWDELAARLAAAGINTLTLDMRGHGESDKPTEEERKKQSGGWPGDIDTAFEYLVNQPGVRRD